MKGEKFMTVIGAPHLLQSRTKSNNVSNKRKAGRIALATAIEKKQAGAGQRHCNDSKLEGSGDKFSELSDGSSSGEDGAPRAKSTLRIKIKPKSRKVPTGKSTLKSDITQNGEALDTISESIRRSGRAHKTTSYIVDVASDNSPSPKRAREMDDDSEDSDEFKPEERNSKRARRSLV